MDNQVTLRLLKFDNEQADLNAKRIAYEVSKMFGDGGGGDRGNATWDSPEVW